MSAAVCLLLRHTGSSAEPKENTNDGGNPRLSSGTNLIASFRVQRGFTVELVAAAPIVVAPVAMAFDENGRLFVVERRDLPGRRDQAPQPGRIRLLEDRDGEGVFNSSAVFADNLSWPSALACYDGGIFVAASSDILYLKDAGGNGLAGARNVIFSGFGGTNPLKPDALLNSFVWGLDNRIHGATAGIGGIVTASNAPAFVPVSVAGCDFAFDPRALTLVPEPGPARSGLTFDSRGRKFISDFARPLRTPMYEPRYALRNSFFPWPPEIIDVASPATAVFRFAQPPSATPAAAPPLLTNRAPKIAAQETGALVPAWLTAARGSVVYRGNAFPSNYLGNCFVADPSARLVHRFVLRENGLEVLAARPPAETNTEFLVSNDPSFRPVQVVNGPDGALYVADAGEGDNSGRIFRIVPDGFKQPAPPRLRTADTYDLVAALAHTNGWRRDTAARLLYERRDPAAIALLTNMFNNSRLPLARLHALHTLDGLGALGEAVVLKGLRDADEHVREHAVLLSEKLFSNNIASDALWSLLKSMGSDPSLRVRYQLAFTLGELRRPERIFVLAEILARNPADRWIRAAILSSLDEGADQMFALLAGDARVRSDAAGWEFLRQLATMIGVRGRLDQTTGMLDFLDRNPMDPAQAMSLLYNLGAGLRRTRSSLALIDPQNRLQRFYEQALSLTLGGNSDPVRIDAMRLLAVSPNTFTNTSDFLLLTLGSGESLALQSAAIAALAGYHDPGIATNLLARWPALSRPLRTQAVSALLARVERVPELLGALETGWVPGSDLTPAQLDFLRSYRDPALRQRALRMFGPVPVKRPDLLKQFKPALAVKGSAARGQEIFRARCSVCHQLGGEGSTLGPDLLASRISGKENVLQAIVEPNTDVRAEYTTYVLESRAGENVIGLVGDANQDTVTVSQPGGLQAVWPRGNIQALWPQPWSLMPPDLAQGFTPQNMADLLDYIMTAPR